MRDNYLIMTRQELYDLVWSVPISDLAKTFGISDVAFAKRCKAVHVPVPPRGYWARVKAGQEPARSPLPKYRQPSAATTRPRYILTNRPEPAVYFSHFDPDAVSADAARVEEYDALRTSIGALPADNTTDLDLLNGHPAVKRVACALKRPWCKSIHWQRGEKDGPTPQVIATDAAADRALQLLAAFLAAADSLGWRLVDPQPEQNTHHDWRTTPEVPKPAYAELQIADERFAFHIEERIDSSRRDPTVSEAAHMKRDLRFEPDLWVHHPTGRIRFVRHATGYPSQVPRKTWYERDGQDLRTKLPKILEDLGRTATLAREKRLAWEEEQRQRAENERRARELDARRVANAKRIASLEAACGAWTRARVLRRFVRAARQAASRHDVSADSSWFLDWAEHYVAQLDPLDPAPRDPDFAPPSYGYHAGLPDTDLKAVLARLTGHAWHGTSKLLAPSEVDPDDAD